MVIISGLCDHIHKLSENCIYVPAATRKRHAALEHLLQTHSIFSKSIMVSMCVQVEANGADVYRWWSEDV